MKIFKMLFKKECSHPFWSQPDVNNIQYCVQCNYGRKVLEDGDCNHKWKYDDVYHASTCILGGNDTNNPRYLTSGDNRLLLSHVGYQRHAFGHRGNFDYQTASLRIGY